MVTKLSRNEEITRATYNKQAKDWSSQHMTSSFWEAEMAQFKKALPNGRILEVGAGGGRDAKELIQLGYNYRGSDVSSGLLEQARQNNPGIKFDEVSVYDLNYDDKFDGFWCSAVLLHIPRNKIDAALSAIRRNMKEGAVGFIAIKEGQGDGLEKDESTSTDKRYFVYWNDKDFSETLSRNGFTVVRKGYKPMSERTKWLTYIARLNKS